MTEKYMRLLTAWISFMEVHPVTHFFRISVACPGNKWKNTLVHVYECLYTMYVLGRQLRLYKEVVSLLLQEIKVENY